MFLNKPRHGHVGEVSDEDLISRYNRSGQASDFDELFARYSRGLFSLCKKYLHDAEESRDAVMQVFEKCLTSFGSAPVSSFRSWLFAMARNECIDILRRKQRAEHRLSRYTLWRSLQLHPEPPGPANDPAPKLRRFIELLNEEQQMCIELFYFEGKSYREIAQQTNLKIKAVKSNLQNGKKRLRKLWLENQA